ncbi:MAG TPA: sigma-54 dependent transcriptional regulator, partial [Candidatus Brocadiales bacterium]|nr:sigma-54 dependent transcriptional regulator [Candidatus Brocadiales bacterium]
MSNQDNQKNTLSLLIVDDDEAFRNIVKDRFSRKGHRVALAASGNEAISLSQKNNFDIALVDIKMPEMNGIELLKQLKSKRPNIEVVILTGHATIDTAIDAIKLGAYHYLAKPCKLAELEVVVQKAHEKQLLSQQNILLREAIQRNLGTTEIIGNSKEIEAVRATIRKVADLQSPVLIEGKSGTGKELVSKALHINSIRANNPFIAVNCASLNENLLESELFGHEKGAFTGAIKEKRGLFEVADGGTLFIDELGEMSPRIQAKLLRVLEGEDFRPLGSIKSISVNVRIVAATNKDLLEEVQKGNFREDLYYRVNVISIKLPTLKDRSEDIPLLVNHFLQHSLVAIKEKKEITPETMDILMNYDWPGNVRELFNILERAIILTHGKHITPDDLPPIIKVGAYCDTPLQEDNG